MGDNSSYILGNMKESEKRAMENSKNYGKRKNKIKGEEHGVTKTSTQSPRRAALVPAGSAVEGSSIVLGVGPEPGEPPGSQEKHQEPAACAAVADRTCAGQGALVAKPPHL